MCSIAVYLQRKHDLTLLYVSQKVGENLIKHMVVFVVEPLLPWLFGDFLCMFSKPWFWLTRNCILLFFPCIFFIKSCLCAAEMITIRFAGWISGGIVSLQPDTDIQKLLSNSNRIRIRISETLLSIFLGFRLLEKLRIAQSFIHYLQKHLFSLLCHDFQFVYGQISAP